MVAEWGSLFVLTSDGGLLQLEEKDTQTKLDTLFKKNLYSVAINLARSQQCDNAVVVDIYRKYGDHLHSKGDYDGAMQQVKRTKKRISSDWSPAAAVFVHHWPFGAVVCDSKVSRRAAHSQFDV